MRDLDFNYWMNFRIKLNFKRKAIENHGWKSLDKKIFIL